MVAYRIRAMARLRRVALVLAAVTPLASSQATLLPSSATDGFPQCALGCAPLQGAAQSCLADPSGQQAIITSCFCQSAILTQLHSSPNGVCDAFCPEPSDLTALQTWYNGFCSGGNQAAADPPPPTTTDDATSNTATINGATSTPVSGSPSGSQADGTPVARSWWNGHWRWILMLIILLLVFGGVIYLAIWYKRRRRERRHPTRLPTPVPFMAERKNNTNHNNSSQLSLTSAWTRTGTMLSGRTRTGTMQSRRSRGDMRDMWGPHQHMAATRGWEYTPDGVVERDPAPLSSSRPGTAGRDTSRSGQTPTPDIREMDPAAVRGGPSGSGRHRRRSSSGGRRLQHRDSYNRNTSGHRTSSQNYHQHRQDSLSRIEDSTNEKI